MSKLYMIALEGVDFLCMVLEMNMLNDIFYKREMFQPKYNWAEVKYLGAIQNIQCHSYR